MCLSVCVHKFDQAKATLPKRIQLQENVLTENAHRHRIKGGLYLEYQQLRVSFINHHIFFCGCVSV